MIRRRLSSGDLMLLELVFAIVFFCLAMAASMSVFGTSYEMSAKAAAKDEAVREVTSAAEIVRSSASAEDAGELLKKAGFTAASSSQYEKKYGEKGECIYVTLSSTETLLTAALECRAPAGNGEEASESVIYSLKVDHCI